MRAATLSGPTDPGLQAERTALSWTRTALAMGVNAALIVRGGLVHDLPLLTGLGAALLGLTALIALYGMRRRRGLLSSGTAITSRAVLLAALMGCAICAAGVAVIAAS